MNIRVNISPNNHHIINKNDNELTFFAVKYEWYNCGKEQLAKRIAPNHPQNSIIVFIVPFPEIWISYKS